MKQAMEMKRTGQLVKKRITDRNGRSTTVWVKPGENHSPRSGNNRTHEEEASWQAFRNKQIEFEKPLIAIENKILSAVGRPPKNVNMVIQKDHVVVSIQETKFNKLKQETKDWIVNCAEECQRQKQPIKVVPSAIMGGTRKGREKFIKDAEDYMASMKQSKK